MVLKTAARKRVSAASHVRNKLSSKSLQSMRKRHLTNQSDPINYKKLKSGIEDARGKARKILYARLGIDAP